MIRAANFFCTIVWIITGILLSAFSIVAIRTMIAFIAWLTMPEESNDITDVLLRI